MASSNNPRKFSEKIALHNQKQAEETAAFEEVMKDLNVTRAARVRLALPGCLHFCCIAVWMRTNALDITLNLNDGMLTKLHIYALSCTGATALMMFSLC